MSAANIFGDNQIRENSSRWLPNAAQELPPIDAAHSSAHSKDRKFSDEVLRKMGALQVDCPGLN